ncbi:hypothetical protein GPALN_003468 [Globodera pallida]|nr:hypothetical protein GPALN_003468 [Globodera pallida]
MGIMPEATWERIVVLLLIGGMIARGNEAAVPSTNSTNFVGAIVSTYAVVVPATFGCRLSGMQCFHDGICAKDGTQCDCSPSPNWFGRQCELRRCAQRHNPCVNGAECEKTAESFKCHCAVGFDGTYCENAVPTVCDKAEENPCVHGTCRVGTTVDDFVCDCHYGYTGTNCTDINFCRVSEVCVNGHCVNEQLNGSRCECRTGWTGQRCEVDIDECLQETTVCQNGGKCVNTFGAFYCDCPVNFVGQFCEVFQRPTNRCLANHFPCLNGGRCHENIVATTAVSALALNKNFYWRWECECPNDFEGQRCERVVDECAMGRLTCLNGGQCARAWAEEARDVNGTMVERNWHSPKCKCLPGLEGDFCERDIDECKLYSGGFCQNGGTCVNRHGSFLCICVGGFDGKHCEINVDDCVDNLCYAGSTCEDGIARYDCRCAPDRIGGLCEFQNICYQANPCERGQCFANPFNGSYACICDDGWNGQNCSNDVDECSDGLTRCFNGKCVNSMGSYKCECDFGYTGEMCSSMISYCADEPCQNGGICYDYLGRFDCWCKLGFSGQNCEIQIEEDLNICRLDCQNGATCKNAFSQSCDCSPKFAGILCEIEKPDPCEFSPCAEGMNCTPTADYNSFTCNCPSAQLFGKRCEHPLAAAPCENGHNPCANGQCRQINVSMEHKKFHCECEPGWEGILCDQQTKREEKNFSQNCPLQNNPCQNGGRCVRAKGRQNWATFFECICPKGFLGPLCENAAVEKHCENGCRNGGKCSKLADGSWGCECLVGFEGAQCEVERNSCSKNPSPCKNMGKCVNLGSDRHRCDCAPGWVGDNCEKNRNDCENIVCANGGKCQDKVNNFWCECSRGFTGRHCEISVPVDKFNRTDLADRESCAKAGCEAKSGDRRCDPECNLFACQFDGGDCSTKQAQPFGRCAQASYCAHLFADGKCDEICNNERCLFDGFDCLEGPQAKCPSMDECAKVYADGHCDEQCNQANCGWDGGDCVNDAHEPDPADDHLQLLPGELFLVVAVHHSTLTNEPTLLRQFLVTLSAHLRASLALSMDQYDKKPKLFEWRSDKGIGQRIELPPELNATSLFNVRYEQVNKRRSKRSAGEEGEGVVEGIALYLRVDVTMCNMISPGFRATHPDRLVGVHTLCFSDVENVAAYVGAANAKKSLNDIPAKILQSEGRIPTPSRLHIWLAVLAFAMVATASAAVGAVFASGRIRKRQRRHAKTWKPEIYDPKPIKNVLATMCGGGRHPPLIVGSASLFNPYTQHNHQQHSRAHQQQQTMYFAGNATESYASSTATSAMPLIKHADSLNSLASSVHMNNQQQQQQGQHFHHHLSHHYAQTQHGQKTPMPTTNSNNHQTDQANLLHQTALYCSRSFSSGIGGSSTEHSPIGDNSHCSAVVKSVENRKILAELRDSALFSRYGLLGQEERLGPCVVNASNERGRTLLHLLFQNPNFEEDEQCLLKNIQLLFTKGAKMNALDSDDTSALLLAVRSQKVLAVRKLVADFEADQRLADADGCTPLYAACECGHVALAEFLIGEATCNSGNPNINNGKRKETPLMRCAIMPCDQWLRIAELLIEAVAPEQRADFVNQTGDAEFLGYSGKTALHWAAECNNGPMVELLVRHGANREAIDQKGRTPLFVAVEQGQYQSTEALLQLHADRNKANSADTKIIPELTSRPGFEHIAELFKMYPEQQHHLQIGRPCSTQQRHSSGEDAITSVKIGTKRPRNSGAKRSAGIDECSKSQKTEIVGAEVAKKAALSTKREQFVQPQQNQTAGTSVLPSVCSAVVSPPPPQNVLTPPNSDQSIYSTSSPSPNNTSEASSNSTTCNFTQQVVQPNANSGEEYSVQQQNAMQQHYQEMFRQSMAVQQQKHLQEHHQYVQDHQQTKWNWANGSGMATTATMATKQKQQQQIAVCGQQLQMFSPTLAYPSLVRNLPHLTPPSSGGNTTTNHLNVLPSGSIAGCYRQLPYKQGHVITREPAPLHQCQNHHLQNGENLKPSNATEFFGLANFACGAEPLSTSLDNLEDLVPDQHLTMEEPSVRRWL